MGCERMIGDGGMMLSPKPPWLPLCVPLCGVNGGGVGWGMGGIGGGVEYGSIVYGGFWERFCISLFTPRIYLFKAGGINVVQRSSECHRIRRAVALTSMEDYIE